MCICMIMNRTTLSRAPDEDELMVYTVSNLIWLTQNQVKVEDEYQPTRLLLPFPSSIRFLV